MLKDNDFIKFQDDFYNLLDKHGVTDVDGDHRNFLIFALLEII
jgi:hypothetical protein